MPQSCALNLSHDTLSAWYDHELPPAEFARLESHIQTCQSCQQRLRVFRQIARVLGQPTPPDFQQRVWHRLHGLLRTQAHSPIRVPRKTLIGGAAVLTTIVVAIALLLRLAPQPGKVTNPLTQTPTSPVRLTNTPQSITPTTTPILGSPWIAVRPDQFGGIAIIPGDTQNLYGCGGDFASKTVTVYQSADRGNAWQSIAVLPIPQMLTKCSIAVNPYHPTLLALEANMCAFNACDVGQTYADQLFISNDSGHDWSVIPQFQTLGMLAWEENGLFIANFDPSNGSGLSDLYFVSVATNQAHLVSPNHSLGGVSVSTIYQITATSDTVYVSFDPPNAQSTTASSTIMKSSDDGVTWQKAVLTDQSAGGDDQALRFVDISIDGGRLIGSTANLQQLGVSADQGLTWQYAPLAPSGLTLNGFSFDLTQVTSDGTWLVVFSNSSGNRGLYRAKSGDSAWQLVQDLSPLSVEIIAVSDDKNGHPTSVWGQLSEIPSHFFRLDLGV